MVLRGTRLIIEKAHPPPKDKNSISHIGCLLFTRIIKQEKGQKQCFFYLFEGSRSTCTVFHQKIRNEFQWPE